MLGVVGVVGERSMGQWGGDLTAGLRKLDGLVFHLALLQCYHFHSDLIEFLVIVKL